MIFINYLSFFSIFGPKSLEYELFDEYYSHFFNNLSLKTTKIATIIESNRFNMKFKFSFSQNKIIKYIFIIKLYVLLLFISYEST